MVKCDPQWKVLMYFIGGSGIMSPDSSSYLSVDELSTLD